MRVLPGAAAVALAFLMHGNAFAGYRPLVWDVSRIGVNSVSVRTGVQLPVLLQPGIGVKTEVLATAAGAITSVPVSVWGSVVFAARKSAATLHNSALKVNLDAQTRLARFSYTDQRAWIASRMVDVQTDRSLTFRTAPGRRRRIRASQSIKLEFPQIDAAFGAAVAADSDTGTFDPSITFEKRFFGRLRLTARLSESTAKPIAGLQIAYNAKW